MACIILNPHQQVNVLGHILCQFDLWKSTDTDFRYTTNPRRLAGIWDFPCGDRPRGFRYYTISQSHFAICKRERKSSSPDDEYETLRLVYVPFRRLDRRAGTSVRECDPLQRGCVKPCGHLQAFLAVPAGERERAAFQRERDLRRKPAATNCCQPTSPAGPGSSSSRCRGSR